MTSDMARLTAAFTDLESENIATRMNYWCCGGCSGYHLTNYIDAENAKRADGEKIIGGVWFHQQDAEDAIKNDGLSLRYSSYPEQSPELTAQIGRKVVEILARHGLDGDWNGDPTEVIEIPAFDVSLSEMPEGERSTLHDEFAGDEDEDDDYWYGDEYDDEYDDEEEDEDEDDDEE